MISLYNGMEWMDKNKRTRALLNIMLYSFFLMILRRLKFMCRRFETLCATFIGGVSNKNNWDEIAKVYIQVKVWLKIAWAIEFRRRGISGKKEYDIQNTAKVRNQQYYVPDQKAIVDAENSALWL